MSWVGKVKELAGGKPADGVVGHERKSNSKIGKENGTHTQIEVILCKHAHSCAVYKIQIWSGRMCAMYVNG